MLIKFKTLKKVEVDEMEMLCGHCAIFSKIMTRIFRNLENICPEFHKSSKIGPEIPNNW